MRKVLFVVAFIFVLLLATSAFAQIKGDYVETRSADVYTGQCFANGEVGLVGDEAILAWHIKDGSWDGVSLAGLSVVGAVKAQATLGDPYGKQYPAKSVLLVDRQAGFGIDEQVGRVTEEAQRHEQQRKLPELAGGRAGA